MTLGKIVEEYLQDHNTSQRSFAKRCGMSSGYISMIVNGINPRSNTPIIPTLKSLNSIAAGMNITLDELLSRMDDAAIELNFGHSKSAERATEFTRLFSRLTDEQQMMIIASIKGILTNDKYALSQTFCRDPACRRHSFAHFLWPYTKGKNKR